MASLDTAIIAWWGAGLSTFLALVKIWELWRARVQVSVSHKFTTHEEYGNEIYIRNLTNHPIIIEYWRLRWMKRIWLQWKETKAQDGGPDENDVIIGAHSSATLSFTEMDHFNWSATSLNGAKIFIELHIAGIKPKLLKVYDPD